MRTRSRRRGLAATFGCLHGRRGDRAENRAQREPLRSHRVSKIYRIERKGRIWFSSSDETQGAPPQKCDGAYAFLGLRPPPPCGGMNAAAMLRHFATILYRSGKRLGQMAPRPASSQPDFPAALEEFVT